MPRVEDMGVDIRLIRGRRIARNFRGLQRAIPGDGILTDTVDALRRGEVSIHGFEFIEDKTIRDSMEFDRGIKSIARMLSNGDTFLAEELRSEMHIVILGMEKGRNKGYYFRAARTRAIEYLQSKNEVKNETILIERQRA